MAILELGELRRKHCLQPAAAYITVGGAIERIADGHIIRGDRLGDGSRCPAHMKKPAGDLLTCTDLGEGPELLQIHIDLKRLLPRAEYLLHLTPFSPEPLTRAQGCPDFEQLWVLPYRCA